MKVLIVDDNPGYRATLRSLLADRFPAVEVAEAPSEADGLAQALSPAHDLVFVDLRLQNGSGFALMKAIKEACPRCIVCVISNYALPEYRSAAFESGADLFLDKGEATASDILAVVESVLQSVTRG
ncbi:response regulator [Ramlibacter sp. PS3R-8]|uniref:response regulator n=1 Tax=Ramlibacter sp. PS3R-8 TaxID=3133437 RepID=UPI00309BF1ED